MAFKFFIFAALIAVSKAGVIQAPYTTYAAASPLVKQVVQEEYDPHPQYSYGYEIHDDVTGDIKSQKESRDGDVVQGSYSLIDADGMKRTVEYTADPEHGFNAVVHREPVQNAKVAYAAPVAKYAAAPLTYTAPVAKYAAAPVVYSAPAAYNGNYAAAPVAYPTLRKTVSYAAPVSYHH